MPPSETEDATLNFILDEVTQISRAGAPDKGVLARKAQNWDRKLAALESHFKGDVGGGAKAELETLGAMGYAQTGPGIFHETDKKLGLIAHELTHVTQSKAQPQSGGSETLGTLRKKVAPLMRE